MMLGSRNKQYPDCAVLLVASRKNNVMAPKVMRWWHWRQSPTHSWGKIIQQEAIVLSTGQEMNWKRPERVNRVLGTDTAYKRYSVNYESYLENLVKEVKCGFFLMLPID